MNHPPRTLIAESLDVWRGERCLFEGLSFSLGPGQTALVMGPNGSGKSTLLRVLAGLTPPFGGSVFWAGVAVHSLPYDQRGEISYRGHIEGLKKDFSVRENLDLYRRIWGHSESPDALLAELGLADLQARLVKYLSAGQKRRLGLATLKVCGAWLWLLDEPTTNLDAAGRRVVADWVHDHTRGGGSAVIATHQPDEFAVPATLAIEL